MGLRRGLSGVPHNEGGPDIVARYFSFDELHQATGGFDALHRIGHGGSSIVYQGKLKDGEHTQAARRAASKAGRGNKFEDRLFPDGIVSHLFLCRHEFCEPISPISRNNTVDVFALASFEEAFVAQ